MRTPLQVQRSVPARPALRLVTNQSPKTGDVLWRINGFRARLLVWTEDEWQKLDAHPSDAQYHPSGIWCAVACRLNLR